MKVKDLIGINPEAEIYIVFSNGCPFTGKLTYGWSSGEDTESKDDTKIKAKEVCIFLGDITETSEII